LTELISGGPEDFLEFLREELHPCPPSHHVSFAAALAERGLALIGEYAGWSPRLDKGASPLQIAGALWDHACGTAIAPDRLNEFESDLSDLAALVDPDRVAAFDSYRGLRLLKLATRCCAPGAGIYDCMTVARASLHISIGYYLSDEPHSSLELREKWDTPSVRTEAMLQSELARTLRSTPSIGRDTVEALRRDFVI
jgi:hypothetical protein